jgi:uncharacterized protein (TIGR02270 family)
MVEQMALSPTAFAAGLYQEHLEEISFLYEYRKSLLDDHQIKWTDIGDAENRLEAHLDALIVGGQPALETCLKKARDGDFGECYGVLRLFCRQNELELVKRIIAGIPAEDGDMATAAGDALKIDMPKGWAGDLVDFMKEDPLARSAIVVRAFGFRRVSPPGGWPDLIEADSTLMNADLIWALGRARERAMRSLVQPLLGHPDPAISSDAALTMLRIGESDTLNICLSLDKDMTWSLIPLGLGGGPQHLSQLQEVPATPDAMLGMGLLGHIGGVNALLKALDNEQLKAFAAMALQTITGADLLETVLIPEAVDEEDLSTEVLKELKRGNPPHSSAERPGVTVTRLSQSGDQWRQWWATHHVAFRADTRYRNGRASSPSVLVDLLAAEDSPRLIRQMAYEELVVRYDADFSFETDMPVSDQLQAITEYRKWADGQKGRFKDGKWYFSGRLLG